MKSFLIHFPGCSGILHPRPLALRGNVLILQYSVHMVRPTWIHICRSRWIKKFGRGPAEIFSSGTKAVSPFGTKSNLFLKPKHIRIFLAFA